MQLDLVAQIIKPGIYSVNRKWTNAMGYTWNLNEHVLVVDHSAPTHCTCALPGGFTIGLIFHLEADRVRSCFKYVGPLPTMPDHTRGPSSARGSVITRS